MSQIRKTVAHDISRAFLIALIASLVVIPSIILFIVLLYKNNSGDLSDTFLIVAAVVWMGVFIGGLLLLIGLTSRRRKKWLDGVFSPLGLTGQRYMLNWWQYEGKFAGRQITARFYKGPTLDLIVTTPLKTRFGFSTPNELGEKIATTLNRPANVLDTPELKGVTAWALDEGWLAGLLVTSEFSGCISRLLNAGQSWALIRQIVLTPERLQLTLYRNRNLFEYDFSTEEVQSWLEDLMRLLQIAESAPPPVVTAELTSLEKQVRSGKLTRRVILILLAFLLLFGACFGLALWLLVRYAG